MGIETERRLLRVEATSLDVWIGGMSLTTPGVLGLMTSMV